MRLQMLVNATDVVREISVVEFPAQEGAARSFRGDWPGSPIYHLTNDGSVMLQSRNLPEHKFPDFASRGRVFE